jgi:hypothetical protein
MKDEYVKFGTAKLLKEKGFDEHCHMVHINNHNSLIGKVISNSELTTTREYKFYKDKENCITIPTQQMACCWLREEHKIHITAEPLEMFKQERIVYEPIIYLLNDFDDFALEYETIRLKECDTNEDAIEAALLYSLENLI